MVMDSLDWAFQLVWFLEVGPLQSWYSVDGCRRAILSYTRTWIYQTPTRYLVELAPVLPIARHTIVQYLRRQEKI